MLGRTIACTLTIVALGLALPGLAFAQQFKPTVFVSVTGDDAVGRRLTYELRTQIAQSPLLTLSDDKESSLIRVGIVTIGSDSDNYVRTSYSFVISLRNLSGGFDYLVDHVVGYCGSNVVASCARDVLTNIVETRDDVVSAFQTSQE